MNSSIIDPISPVPSIVVGVRFVVPEAVVIVGMLGAIVSRVIIVAPEAADVLIPSDAVAVNELAPSASTTFVNCQSPEPSAV